MLKICKNKALYSIRNENNCFKITVYIFCGIYQGKDNLLATSFTWLVFLLVEVSKDEFTCVPIQGSGTFAVEAVFQTAVPRQGGKVVNTL